MSLVRGAGGDAGASGGPSLCCSIRKARRIFPRRLAKAFTELAQQTTTAPPVRSPVRLCRTARLRVELQPRFLPFTRRSARCREALLHPNGPNASEAHGQAFHTREKAALLVAVFRFSLGLTISYSHLLHSDRLRTVHLPIRFTPIDSLTGWPEASTASPTRTSRWRATPHFRRQAMQHTTALPAMHCCAKPWCRDLQWLRSNYAGAIRPRIRSLKPPAQPSSSGP